MEKVRISRYGIWTYKESLTKPFVSEWFKNHVQIWPLIWKLTKMVTPGTRWWLFGLIFGTGLRAVVAGTQLRLYAALVREKSIINRSRSLKKPLYFGLLLTVFALAEEYKASGIVERNLIDTVTKGLMDVHLHLTSKEVQDPRLAHDFRIARSKNGHEVSLPIADAIGLFRSLLSITAQGYALSGLVSSDVLPFFVVCFFESMCPLLHILFGEAPGVVKEITNPFYYRMRSLRELALDPEKRKYVLTLGLEKYILDEFDKANSRIPKKISYWRPHALTRHPHRVLLTGVQKLLDIMLYVCAVRLSSGNDINLQTIIVMKSASSSIIDELAKLYLTTQRATEELRSMAIYLKYMHLSQPLPKSETLIAFQDPTQKGMEIEAHNIAFTYEKSRDDQPVLRELSFKFEAGKTIGIVGLNGAGKSTLVNLLSFVEKPTSGLLKINGHNVSQYDVQQLRKNVAVLFQDRLALSGFSIREYIQLGNVESINDEQAVQSAIASSGFANVMSQLPNALNAQFCYPFNDELYQVTQSLGLEQTGEDNSSITDKFVALSGGQKQLLALAQTFMRLSDAALLILDEPSSHLDPVQGRDTI